MHPPGIQHLTTNAIAGTVKTASTAKRTKVPKRKKARAEVGSDDMRFLQEATDSLFQYIDKLEAADARRKTG